MGTEKEYTKMIPIPLRNELNKDPFYKKCCITGRIDGKIDWHHNLIFGGKQVNEKFAILPVHSSIHQYHKGITSKVKEKLNWIMVNRMSIEELEKYSKAIDYKELKIMLNKEYELH